MSSELESSLEAPEDYGWVKNKNHWIHPRFPGFTLSWTECGWAVQNEVDEYYPPHFQSMFWAHDNVLRRSRRNAYG